MVSSQSPCHCLAQWAHRLHSLVRWLMSWLQLLLGCQNQMPHGHWQIHQHLHCQMSGQLALCGLHLVTALAQLHLVVPAVHPHPQGDLELLLGSWSCSSFCASSCLCPCSSSFWMELLEVEEAWLAVPSPGQPVAQRSRQGDLHRTISLHPGSQSQGSGS